MIFEEGFVVVYVDVKALQSMSIIRNNVKLLDILAVTIEHKSHSTLKH